VQEAVGGALADELAARLGDTDIETDTAEKLRTILASKLGLDYQFARAFSNGVPGVLAVFNAILSRCSIKFSLAKRLPPAEELDVRGREIELGRSVLMSRISIPELGEINVYNTHLCANCRERERLDQAESVTEFVRRVDRVFPGIGSILAGDFNTNIASINGFHKPVYQLIRGAGFVDSYVEGNPNTNIFCSEAEGGPRLGCTFGVSDLGASMRPARIDFIFFKRHRLRVQDSRVVFNPLVAGDAEPSVSNHSAVFTQLQFAQE
jgi:maltose 6'-phosphate phosphatase